MQSRRYIAGAVALSLLIWGPRESGVLVHLGYIVLVPLILWGVLWLVWRPSKAADERSWRTLLGVTAGLFLAWAFEPLYDGFDRKEDGSHIFNMVFMFVIFFLISRAEMPDTKD